MGKLRHRQALSTPQRHKEAKGCSGNKTELGISKCQQLQLLCPWTLDTGHLQFIQKCKHSSEAAPTSGLILPEAACCPGPGNVCRGRITRRTVFAAICWSNGRTVPEELQLRLRILVKTFVFYREGRQCQASVLSLGCALHA